MTDFLDALERAATELDEPEPAQPRTPWDEVLDTFIGFLNRKYADDLHAFRQGGAGPGVVQLMVCPRGWRNQRTTLLVFHFTRSSATVLGANSDEITSTHALEQRLASLIRTSAFRHTVTEMRKVSHQPVTGVLHAGGLRDRRPSTDVLVTISREEQLRLADASEARARSPITLHAHLAGPSPAGQGTYTPATELRWLLAGGYGLALAEEHGHAPEQGGMIKLSGTPVDPDALG